MPQGAVASTLIGVSALMDAYARQQRVGQIGAETLHRPENWVTESARESALPYGGNQGQHQDGKSAAAKH